jgi:hypothetical protein
MEQELSQVEFEELILAQLRLQEERSIVSIGGIDMRLEQARDLLDLQFSILQWQRHNTEYQLLHLLRYRRRYILNDWRGRTLGQRQLRQAVLALARQIERLCGSFEQDLLLFEQLRVYEEQLILHRFCEEEHYVQIRLAIGRQYDLIRQLS